MVVAENSHYEQTERFDSSSYWYGSLVLDSLTEDLGYDTSRSVLLSGLMLTTPDIKSVGTGQKTGALEVAANLEAEDEVLAMTKLSGLALLSLRKAGIDIAEVTLLDERLVSGWQLAQDYPQNVLEGLQDARYARPHLEGIFDDIQACMVRYNAPTTY